MRKPTGIEIGLAKGLGLIAVLAAGLTYCASQVPPASANLLEGIAAVGTALFLAYVVEISWLVPRLRSYQDHPERIGVLVAFGLAGLVGVVAALLVASHRAAGHANLLDDLGLGWATASLLCLGALVVVQPLLIYEWTAPSESPEDD